MRHGRRHENHEKSTRKVNNMKIITVNLSEPQVKALQVLQDLGLYPSRSEAIRVAIRDFLQRELGMAKLIDENDRFESKNDLVKPVATLDVERQAAEKKKEISRLLRKLREEQPGLTTIA